MIMRAARKILQQPRVDRNRICALNRLPSTHFLRTEQSDCANALDIMASLSWNSFLSTERQY